MVTGLAGGEERLRAAGFNDSWYQTTEVTAGKRKEGDK